MGCESTLPAPPGCRAQLYAGGEQAVTLSRGSKGKTVRLFREAGQARNRDGSVAGVVEGDADATRTKRGLHLLKALA